VERESFEAYFLEHPELLIELNRTAQFKSGLIDLRDSGALTKLLKATPWWQSPRVIAIAASLVLVVVAGGIWLDWQVTSRPLLATSVAALSSRFQSTMPIASSFDIQRTRSSSYDATIKIPTNSAAIELRIKPEALAQPARYRIALGTISSDGSVKLLTEVTGARLANDGFVAIYLNASQLAPAVYELKISGDAETSSANSASSFLIEFVTATD
jgi:hypothetical protein